MSAPLKVGQKLWAVWGYSHRGAGQQEEVTVTKVGRRWAEITGHHPRISMDFWTFDGGGYFSDGACFASKEVYEEKVAADAAWASLKSDLPWNRPEGVTKDAIAEATRLLQGKARP